MRNVLNLLIVLALVLLVGGIASAGYTMLPSGEVVSDGAPPKTHTEYRQVCENGVCRLVAVEVADAPCLPQGTVVLPVPPHGPAFPLPMPSARGLGEALTFRHPHLFRGHVRGVLHRFHLRHLPAGFAGCP